MCLVRTFGQHFASKLELKINESGFYHVFRTELNPTTPNFRE